MRLPRRATAHVMMFSLGELDLYFKRKYGMNTNFVIFLVSLTSLRMLINPNSLFVNIFLIAKGIYILNAYGST